MKRLLSILLFLLAVAPVRAADADLTLSVDTVDLRRGAVLSDDPVLSGGLGVLSLSGWTVSADAVMDLTDQRKLAGQVSRLAMALEYILPVEWAYVRAGAREEFFYEEGGLLSSRELTLTIQREGLLRPAAALYYDIHEAPSGSAYGLLRVGHLIDCSETLRAVVELQGGFATASYREYAWNVPKAGSTDMRIQLHMAKDLSETLQLNLSAGYSWLPSGALNQSASDRGLQSETLFGRAGFKYLF